MKIKKQRRILGPMLLLIGWILIANANAIAANDDTKLKVDYEAGFYYTVKKGDTLWDLSQRFSDTPWQWPDLWRENKQLPNPHWIYPGERIRLYRKTDQHRVEKPAVIEVPTIAPQVEATVPEEQPKPQIEYFYANIDRVGFIRYPAVEPSGIIFKSLDNKKLISKGDLIYIRYPDAGKIANFTPGSRLTAYRLVDPNGGLMTDATNGNQHYLLGIVEITKIETQYAIAKVIESFRAIHFGDMVMPYEPRTPNVPVVESTPGIETNIIAAEEHVKIMGDLNIAFIDKGTNDQILPGQIYNIYYQETTSEATGGTSIKLNPVEIGSLLVLHTEKTASTVVITNSSRKITPGQPVHTP